MSKRTSLWLSVGLITVVILVAVLIVLQSARAKAAPGVPNSPEAKEIMAVMERAYRIIGVASQTFDLAEFSSVFVDSPDYKLNGKQKEAVAGVLGNATAESAGYLTAMQAQYISLGQGAQLLQAALAKAKAENREITAQEFQDIIQANHGQMPALGSPITTQTVLTYDSMEIDGDKATVRYDDGAAQQEATLVRIKGRWFITGIIPLWVHF
jgi:hypothetical protein